MSLMTYVASTEVRENKDTVEGKVFTKPTLIYTDGINVTYGCDVDIGVEGPINQNGDIGILVLKNVPIAQNNRNLRYAEVGQAVTLTRSGVGRWEITGFAKTMPGTFTFVPVMVSNICFPKPLQYGEQVGPVEVLVGTPYEIGVEVRVLAYDELIIYGEYGTIPYGAVGVFQNGSIVEIRST